MRCFDPQLSCVQWINVCICTSSKSVLACVYLYSRLSSLSVCVCVCFPRYFPASSTQEMLDEWRPLLCVFDVVMQKAISNMELFLPTIMPPEEHGQGFQ